MVSRYWSQLVPGKSLCLDEEVVEVIRGFEDTGEASLVDTVEV